jgi:hypothetical protein
MIFHLFDVSFEGDSQILYIYIGLLVLIFSSELLTKYRISKGFFGCNASEAKEIIEFIFERRVDLNIPPGGRPLFEDAISQSEKSEKVGSSVEPIKS